MTHQQRSYLMPGLTPADRELLAGVPRKASLADEIGYLRLRISKLAEAPENSDTKREDDDRLLRMLQLLTRMVDVQSKLGEDAEDEFARAGELARQRLLEAARKAAG
ncbi:MAG TPA: hypothetical protein VK009_00500 [Chloroflexota bacterium]|nr:hypothetical protein [Chloroflexota bacterium]